MNQFDTGVVEQRCASEIQEYVDGRRSDIKRGAETPRLAALMIEKFVWGMTKGLGHLKENGVHIDIASLQKMGDDACREIDPEFEVNRQARWDARPADLNIG